MPAPAISESPVERWLVYHGRPWHDERRTDAKIHSALRISNLLAVFAMAAVAGCNHDTAQRSGEHGSGTALQAEKSASEQDPAGLTPTRSTAAAASTTTIPWDELPPIDTPADLVTESYDGGFLAYSTVIDSGGGPTLYTPTIAESLP